MTPHSTRTLKGEHAKQQLYEKALELMRSHGVGQMTLRQLAQEAGVSPGLFYRYFPTKDAILIQLFNTLSLDYLERIPQDGAWTARIHQAIGLSIQTLGPHRDLLIPLIPHIMSAQGPGLFSVHTAFVRGKMQRGFIHVMEDALDAPKKQEVQGAIGRLMYLLHMGIVVFWLLDRSPDQAATARLVSRLKDASPWMTFAMQLAKPQEVMLWLDGICQDALIPPTDPVYQETP